MLFNSIEFAIFLPVVFILYWFVVKKDLKLQNVFLLIASYFFYSWWDWRFLLLLLFNSIMNYFVGIGIHENETKRRRNNWLALGLIVNIGSLCVFKYYNFFIDSFIDLVSLFGYQLSRHPVNIILPLGISFYTFLSLSYIIDIYKRNSEAHRNFVEVLLTLSFFPIILAGPIQRPSTLLPQITTKRVFEFDKAVDGLRQILWGLFKKVVLADTCGANADYIFSNHGNIDGSVLIMGVVYYAFQIYGDFSGYSDMAIGTARLFGINLMRNFAYPYFARDISEFWQRWHISLTSWLRDYIFMPISVSISWKISKEKVLFIKTDMFIYIIASLITWFLTGFWHGANYTFIIWGMIHGFFLILYQWQKQPRKKLFKTLGIKNSNPLIVFFDTILTLLIVLFAWIFFRAPSINEAFAYIHDIFANGVFSFSILDLRGKGITSTLIDATIAIVVVALVEWIQRKKLHALEIGNLPVALRWGIYWVLAFICLFYFGNERIFIYLQF
jgi:alginate O-acetyltransferase complex protein AlgI